MGFKWRWKPILKWGAGALTIIILLGLAFPCTHCALSRAQAIQMASNGSQIAIAMNQMADDLPPRSPRYPADFPPTTTAAEYLAYLVKTGYLKEGDLRILSAPHYPQVHTVSELSDKTIPFTIFRVSVDDPPDTVFLASKSGVFKDAVIVVRKNGERRAYRISEALNVILQHLPALQPRTISKLSNGKMFSFIAFPVTDSDPPDTVFAVSTPESLENGVVVIWKGGDAQSYQTSKALDMILPHLVPSHPPAFLP